MSFNFRLSSPEAQVTAAAMLDKLLPVVNASGLQFCWYVSENSGARLMATRQGRTSFVQFIVSNKGHGYIRCSNGSTEWTQSYSDDEALSALKWLETAK